MKKVRVGLNGFGRIGRAIARIILENNLHEIALINTRKTAPDLLAYLLQYDSVYRTLKLPVLAKESSILVGNTEIPATMTADISAIDWNAYGVDIVIDATGAFTTKEDLQKHIRGSVKKVVLTAPSKDDSTAHVVMGVNSEGFDWAGEQVISNASCTTNCAAPLFKVLQNEFGIEMGYLTTVHSYTATQSLLDEANKKPDRSRAAALNIAPSTTGAAKAVARVIPELKGKLDGMAVRVPTPTVSFTDISAVVKRDTTAEEVNSAFSKYARGDMRGILGYETAPLVSSDYVGDVRSSIFDANYTKVMNKRLVKVFGWYDNEWGYSCRVVDVVSRLSEVL